VPHRPYERSLKSSSRSTGHSHMRPSPTRSRRSVQAADQSSSWSPDGAKRSEDVVGEWLPRRHSLGSSAQAQLITVLPQYPRMSLALSPRDRSPCAHPPFAQPLFHPIRSSLPRGVPFHPVALNLLRSSLFKLEFAFLFGVRISTPFTSNSRHLLQLLPSCSNSLHLLTSATTLFPSIQPL
jgi:hypothetical protein